MTATILAVDDSNMMRKMIESVLRSEHYLVLTAADGAAALEALERQPCDMLVLDINMPHMDGLSLLKTLRERGDELPILMLTTEGQESDRDRALALGATDYLVKPFKPAQLLERVAACLKRPGAEHDRG